MKRKRKIVIATLAVLIATTLVVSAGLLSYYGKIETNANVQQSVVVDGRNWDEPITHEFDIPAGCTKMVKHKVTNRACVEAMIDIETVINAYGKGPEGVNVDYSIKPGWKQLVLENKNENWQPIDDEYYAHFWWNPCCPEFTWKLEGKFMPETEYVLIYYSDQPERFTNWGGAPALEIATFLSDANGNFTEEGSMDIGACLPYPDDWNIGPEADYTQPPDNYIHGKGAKIWLIPAYIYNGCDEELNGWAPDEILFETDLIFYGDCDINPLPEYLYPYFDYCICQNPIPYLLQPGEEICLFIVYNFDVAIIPGLYTIETTVVPLSR